MALARRLLPGDPEFGDPLSTMGTEPVQAVARRAYQLADGRLSILGQLGLAVLPGADWGQDGGTPRPGGGAIAVTDPGGFSGGGGEIGGQAAPRPPGRG